MTWVALAALAGWAATVIALAGLLRSQARGHARREDLVLNQLLHAVGKAWQPSPASEARALEPEPEPRQWTPSPEQLPV